jgi:hypothetical protein
LTRRRRRSNRGISAGLQPVLIIIGTAGRNFSFYFEKNKPGREPGFPRIRKKRAGFKEPD